MSEGYNPTSAEAKWQKRWADARLHHPDLAKAKKPYYNLVMFPYPSGDKLHIGHWYNFAPADSHGRFMRMKGYDVFEPMGFDAFGLPAENYAVKTGVPPAQSIAKNVETMVEQLKRMGTMYDWDAMVNTSTPEYYRWTQWLFLQMYEHKLAYKREAPVNWCPKDQTVLANEQAQDGTCDRCGTPVEQKLLTQWFWKITDYSQKLLDNLETLDWPEKTKAMQRNWIARSEGAEIEFSIQNNQSRITIFTTRPDTLFGATYLVLAPEHPLVPKITSKEKKDAINKYIDAIKNKTDLQRTDLNKNKTGVFTGGYALHPVTNEPIPVWIADYVLASYGSGAIMAVPSHDERDWEFAKAYELPVKCVIEPDEDDEDLDLVGGKDEDPSQRMKQVKSDILLGKQLWDGDGRVINSEFLNGLDVESAKVKMIEWLKKNKKGTGVAKYRLKDWLLSRQRYWGAPIPIVYDPEGKPHPIPEKHLPWLLPTDVEFKPTGESPLRHSKEFKARTEKLFGKGWTPEYDTMDTFVCSSFYYLRFLAAHDNKHLIDPKIEKQWMPVSMYIGGPEHACMHLIYARFVMMALKDFGFVSHEEPFQRLVHQGLITHKGAKMSKSKGNVVSPDAFVERFGSDVFRMYLMFMGPFTDGGDWNDAGIKGIDRFVQRVWKIVTDKVEPQEKGKKKSTKVVQDSPEALRALHNAIKRVTESMEKLHFNTAISSLMELTNALEGQPHVSVETAKSIARLLAPLAPHLADELWEKLAGEGFIVEQAWPEFDPKLLVSDTMTIVVQVNGKVRGNVEVARDASKDEVLAAARSEENVKKYLEGGTKKEIYVPGKLVSFVV